MTGDDPSAVIDAKGADGAVLRLRRHGDPRARLRVFVSHGNGFAIDGYAAFWGRLAADCEVIAFDMRNHGRNPLGLPAHHDYAHMARDLDAVCEAARAAFGPRPSAGLFHSMSAQAALLQAMAGDGTAPLDALVLFDPPNLPPQPGPAREAMLAYLHRLAGWARGRRAQFADPDELARDYAGTRAGRGWIAGAQAAMARAVLRPDPAGDWRLACPPALEADMYEQGITIGLWPRRADVPLPVLLVGADPDRAAPAPTALANRDLARDGGFAHAAIPETGHLLQLERPQACLAAALDFLAANGLR